MTGWWHKLPPCLFYNDDLFMQADDTDAPLFQSQQLDASSAYQQDGVFHSLGTIFEKQKIFDN